MIADYGWQLSDALTRKPQTEPALNHQAAAVVLQAGTSQQSAP
jgi:hypothetical protein